MGVNGGEVKVGVGSRVESAETPVSPRSSPPRLLDLRRDRGMLEPLGPKKIYINTREALRYWIKERRA